MPVRHRLLAILVAACWGVNFLAIHASLEQFPPFLCSAMRWTLLAVPTILFVPRPKVPVRYLMGYGIGFGILQFTFLYWGMSAGMPTGLASLVLQCSAPFTVILGAVLLHEPTNRRKALGVAVAVAGLAIVGSARAGGATWWPFVLTVLGGLGWALGNLASRLAAPPNPLHLTMWMSVVPPLPMLALSLIVEGPQRDLTALRTAASAPWALAGLAYTCLIGTVLGSGLWTWLMARHPASTVAPYSMLVPVVGLSTAWVVLDERPSVVELVGAVVVVAGVLFASTTRLRRSRASRSMPAALGSPSQGPA
ncbi:EamA family transporter [Calidifontibacter sp. DB0510]|uniref:EamA family transporter n=1 Tax=Metallococcus carri TaxID=1656884 RepID=A0A967B1B0_9MICO|nr:EamA family transporter [Metallococcus carri]NHN56976.1 EamA family transporter [Metallococcus carri]NOP37721.1 EamA family transporter [Calidifontibacter sp. DB2511S]